MFTKTRSTTFIPRYIETVVLMFAGMLVAMLLRLDEYTGHAHHARDAIAA
jgi:hypothetical protein